MKSTYLNNSVEDSYSLFSRIKSGIRKAGLAALVGTIIGVGVYGCKKEEPQKEGSSPKQSVSLENKLYKQTKIAFSSWRDGNGEIYVMNTDGSEQKNLTNNPAIDIFSSWSPDGKRIAFSSDRDGNDEIYVMNADESEQRRLTNNPASDTSPSWSPFLPLENKTNEKK